MHPYPKHGNADDRGCQNILLLILGEVTNLAEKHGYHFDEFILMRFLKQTIIFETMQCWVSNVTCMLCH